MKLILRIALTHLRGRLRQTLLSVLGVATGVGFSIAMAALMEGSQQDFIERMVNAAPHIVVKDEFREPPAQPVQAVYANGAVSLEGLKPKEELRGIRNPKPKVAALDQLPGITAAPKLRGQVVITFGGKDLAVALVGIEPKRETRVSDREEDMTVGSFDSLFTTANGIIIGAGVAKKLGAKVGDTLTASSSAGVLLKMKIVGLFTTGVVALDSGEGLALLKKVQILMDRPNVINEIGISIPNPRQARDVARFLEPRLGYKTESWDEANEGLLEVFEIRNLIMYTTVGAILVVAAFGIFNIVSTITFEKVRDIAIMKSLGFRARDMRIMFLLEGTMMGLVGMGLGWILGYALCRVLGAIKFEVEAFTELKGLPVIYEPSHYLIAGAAAVLAAALAGYIPARRASKLNPVDIIRSAA